jgi:hypothetical protein
VRVVGFGVGVADNVQVNIPRSCRGWYGTPHKRSTPLVRPAVNGEILPVVVESGRRPTVSRVAARAVRTELCRCVIRGWSWHIEVRRVASQAGIRGVVVIPVVAGGAIVGNDRVRAVERIKIVVVWQRLPAPNPAAVVWQLSQSVGNAQRHVVRIGTLVVIRAVWQPAQVFGVLV